MSDDIVTVDRDSAVATVTLNYPRRRNAFSPALKEALHDRLVELSGDAECRAIVLTGAAGTFCSGGDISEMRSASLLDSRARMQNSHRIIRLLVNGRKPVVAAVEGFAYGAGLSLALACDYVVAAANASFSASFVRVGLMGDMGLFWTLPQRVGLGKAKAMLALATAVDGGEAVRIGLADQLAEPGGALVAALEVAHRFAAGPPVALALTKAAFAQGCLTLDDALSTEVDYQSMLFQTTDHREAAAAFLEKRKPEFAGK
jgi:enoyl-CoA hydratase/carnithine racemase